MAADTMDRACPAGSDRQAARQPGCPGRARQLAHLGTRSRERIPLWRTFLAEQRALLRELDKLVSAVPSVQAPVLLLADPKDALVPVDTARRLAETLRDARLQLVEGAGHHLRRRAPDVIANAIVAFVAAAEAAGSQAATRLQTANRPARR
jgi:pimeloyl-ACP methyl ester carboxylesterase